MRTIETMIHRMVFGAEPQMPLANGRGLIAELTQPSGGGSRVDGGEVSPAVGRIGANDPGDPDAVGVTARDHRGSCRASKRGSWRRNG